MNPFPTPVLRTEDSADFFDATCEEALLLRRCTSCGTVRGPQEPACPECQTSEHETLRGSGKAHLVTWSIVHRSPLPGVQGPYVTGFVECVEGPWLPVRLLVDPDCELAAGAAVRISFVLTGNSGDGGERIPVGIVGAGTDVER